MKIIYVWIGLSILQPAFGANGPSNIDPACEADAKKVCADSKAEDRGQCLSTHKYALSQACVKRSDHIRASYEKVHKMDKVCRKDYQQFCGGLTTPMKRYECIQSHVNQVSPACQKAVAKAESSK